MASLIITALAVFWAWEFIIVVLPRAIPPWLQPLIVLGISVGFGWPDWRTGAAAAGLVAVLHVVVNHLLNAESPVPQPVARTRPPRVPPLP